MLVRYFTRPSRIEQLRSSTGGHLLEGFANELSQGRYQWVAARKHIRAAEHFLHWIAHRNQSITSVEERYAQQFLDHLKRCRCRGHHPPLKPHRQKYSVDLWFDQLRHVGIVPSPTFVEPAVEAPMLTSFCDWMRRQRGVSDATLSIYRFELRAFIKDLGEDPHMYDARNLRQFVLDKSRRSGWAMFENRPLDVQCVPIVTTRQVSREIAEGGLGDAVVMDFVSDDWPRWVMLAGNDAMQFAGGPVRGFLWSVADKDARADFESFVKIYDALDESLPPSNILELTAELFPGPTDGRRLKKAVFGAQKTSSIPRIEPKEVLVALATTDHYESFDLDELSLREQASRLLTEQPTAGCLLLGELFRASLNPIGEEILKALILAMGPEDALAFVRDQQQFLPALFRANAALATSAKLWVVAGGRKRELFDSLAAEPSLQPELVRGIVDALLDSNSDTFIGRAFSQWGKVAVLQALDWIEVHGATITDPCRAALTSYVREVMTWLGTGRERSTAMLAAVAHVVAPYSSQIAHNESTVWVRTLHTLRENHREDEANYVSAFVLALALCNAPPAPLDLVSESFERVHWLAEKELLRDDAWFILQPLVPELSWRKNWDKCERMRRALMSAFVRYAWPARQLRDRITNPDLLEQLLKSARKIDIDLQSIPF